MKFKRLKMASVLVAVCTLGLVACGGGDTGGGSGAEADGLAQT